MSHRIEFRLSPDYFRQLSELGQKRDQGPNPTAKQVVIEFLDDEQRHALSEQITKLQKTIDDLREDLRVTVTALLVHAGKTELNDAEAWVENNLR